MDKSNESPLTRINKSHPFSLLYSPAGLKEIIIYSGGHP